MKWKALLKKMIELCPNVSQLVCSLRFGSANLQAAVQAWSKLHEVSLPAQSPKAYLAIIAKNCDGLRSIVVAGPCPQLNDTCWSRFFETVNIRLHHLCTHTSISKAALLVMAQHCTQLQSLRGDLECLDDQVLVQIAVGYPVLETLELPDNISSGPGLQCVTERQHLLELRAGRVPPEILRLSPQIRKLHIGSGADDPEVFFSTLADCCPALAEIEYWPGVAGHSTHRRPYSDYLPHFLQHWPLLEILSLHFFVGAATITALGQQCHHLRRLDLHVFYGSVDDTIVTAFAMGCPKLQRLSVQLSAPVTMVGISALATHCRELRKVHVYRSVLGVAHRDGKLVLLGRKLRVSCAPY
jgi:hypothetical protein